MVVRNDAIMKPEASLSSSYTWHQVPFWEITTSSAPL